jgi:hypothetical protein
MCTSCGSNVQPIYSGNDQGVSLYGDPTLNAPLFDPGIQNPAPIYSETGAVQSGGSIGEIQSVNGVLPPQF